MYIICLYLKNILSRPELPLRIAIENRHCDQIKSIKDNEEKVERCCSFHPIYFLFHYSENKISKVMLKINISLID